MQIIKFNHYVSVLIYTWHDNRPLPAATLSTKRKTKSTVMATRLHFIHNMFPPSLNYFPLPARRLCDAVWCTTEQKKPPNFVNDYDLFTSAR